MGQKRFIYEIVGFIPPLDDNTSIGGFGFSIYLDREMAKKAFSQEISE